MERRTLDISFGKNSYKVAITFRRASNDLLFCIHGLGCSKDSFREIWYQDNLKKMSILLVDLIGFGDSEKPDQFSYSMEDQARICDELLKQYSDYRLHIIAHSMGGAVGLLLSDATLNSTGSFINVEGNLISEDCGLISRKSIQVPFEKFAQELFPSFLSQFQEIETKYLTMTKTSPTAFYRSSESLVAWSDSGRLMKRFSQLKCKQLYLYGEENSGMTVLSRLGNIAQRAIRKSGHFMMIDNPTEFYTEIINFIPIRRIPRL